MVTSLASWPGWSGALRKSRPVGPSGLHPDRIGPARRLVRGALASTLTGACPPAAAPPGPPTSRARSGSRAGWRTSDGRGGRQYLSLPTAAGAAAAPSSARDASPPAEAAAGMDRAAPPHDEPRELSVGFVQTRDWDGRTTDRAEWDERTDRTDRSADGQDGGRATAAGLVVGGPDGLIRTFEAPRATTVPADSSASLPGLPLLRNDGMM